MDSLITTVQNYAQENPLEVFCAILVAGILLFACSAVCEENQWRKFRYGACHYCGAKPTEQHAENCRIAEVHRD